MKEDSFNFFHVFIFWVLAAFLASYLEQEQVRVGYTHYDTYVYGSPALNKRPIPENHVWLQGTFMHQFGDLKLTNRLRDENRFVGIATNSEGSSAYQITDYKYRNRLRYMVLATYPILKKDKSLFSMPLLEMKHL